MPAPLRARLLGAGLIAAGLAAGSVAGLAYVPTTTVNSGTSLRWMDTSTISIRINSSGSDNIKDGSDIAAAKKSMDNWIKLTRHCSRLTFTSLPESPTAARAFVKKGENENVIVWVEKGWPHEPLAAALTTIFYADQAGHAWDGRILDADIELNGQYFTYSSSGSGLTTDIENTITHELGHVLGLDHVCDDGKTTPTPKDHTGATVPRCGAASMPAWAYQATMYNYADPGETKKRTPEKDDILGFCSTYPIVEEEGCAVGPGGLGARPRDPAPGLLLLLGLALVWRLRRLP